MAFAIRSFVVAGLIAAVFPAATPAATVRPDGVRFPHVAVNARGATVLAWERFERRSFAILARAGGVPGRLGRVQRLTGKGLAPRVAVGSDGTMAVIWQRYEADRMQSLRVVIARPGMLRFGRQQVLQRRRGIIVPLGVAVQKSGRVVAIWRAGARARYALARRGHGFGTSRDLGVAAGGVPGYGAPAIDSRDGAVVAPTATSRFDGVTPEVRVLTLRARAFSTAQFLPAGAATGAARVVGGPAGVGVAVLPAAGETALELVRRRSDGGWDSPQRVATQPQREGVFARDLTVALPSDGSAVAAWTVGIENVGESGGKISSPAVTSIAPFPAAPFGPPVLLTPPIARADAPALAAAGDATYAATALEDGRVLLARRPAGAVAFAAPQTLTRHGDGDVQLAAAGRHVLAAFQRSDRLQLVVVR